MEMDMEIELRIGISKLLSSDWFVQINHIAIDILLLLNGVPVHSIRHA